MTTAEVSTVATKEAAAVQKLEVLLDKSVPDHTIPPATEVKVLPDGGIRVGKFRSLWRRFVSSTVIWLNSLSGILCTVILAVPPEMVSAVIPVRWAAGGMLAFNVVSTLARMRTI